MFEAFKKLKLASAFLGYPAATGESGTLSASDVFGDLDVDKLEAFGGDIDAIFDAPGVAQLYENGYMPAPERPAILLDLPDDTLGYELGLYLKRHNVKTHAPGPYRSKDRVAYVRERVRVLHPLVHVLAEYDATPIGELAVQAFFVGQFGNLASGTILSAGLLRVIQDSPGQLGDALQLVAEAFERGRNARPLLGMPWEEFFPAPSAQIRDLFGLSPRTSTFAHLSMEQAHTQAQAQAQVAAHEPEPEPEPTPDLRRRREPEPEPAFSQGRAYGARPKTRWAGLDLLSEGSSSSSSSSSTPEPQPEPETRRSRERERSAPSTLAEALSAHTARTAAQTAPTPKPSESPLAGFFAASQADPPATEPPAPEAPRLDLRGPPRRAPPNVETPPGAAAPQPSRSESASDATNV